MIELLSQTQLAKLANCSVKSVQRYIADGKIQPEQTIAGQNLYSISQVGEVEKLCAQGKKSGRKTMEASESTGRMIVEKRAAARLQAQKFREKLQAASWLDDLL